MTTGTAEKMKVITEQVKIGTWNVQTLWSTGKLELLQKEMEVYNCDILGLAEMRWTGSGEMNGGEVIWSGEEKIHTRAVSFLLNKRARNALLSYNAVNARIIAARFRGAPLNLAVVQVYAPTADSSDEEIERFYKDLEKVHNELPNKGIKVIVGDWNAKVGTNNSGWETVMGRYGYGDQNDRGERLLEFATKSM